MRWTDVVQSDAEPWQVLSALLGLLELARLGELRVAQPRPFANVDILNANDPNDTPGEAA
jgi:segregation and condensation protein A